jgi:2-dehydropantoate 2-reductase
MKIAISGIGGVGGYIGGLLAKEFANSADVEIYFISRGTNEAAIREQGLHLITVAGEHIVHPKLVTSDPALIGPVDLLISCTKGYSLVENMLQCKPCVTAHTIILPLQNGVDSHAIIADIYPENDVCDGCVYMVAALTEPGLVKETGGKPRLFFGSDIISRDKLKPILDLFLQAGINATLADNIKQVVWEKFIFISALATCTSYYDSSIGPILADPVKKNLLLSLVPEVASVAVRKNIAMPENIVALTMDKISALAYNATTSLHKDFSKGGQTEVESLTGYFVRSAKELGVPVPTF